MAYLFPGSLVPALDNTGDPLSGAKMYVYLAETTTLTPSYTSDEAAVENTNPVVSDSSGKWAPVYLDPDIPVRIKVTNAAGDYTLYDVDYISPGIPGSVALYSALAANGGAALIGTAGGITVEEALAAAGKAFGLGLFSSFAGTPPSIATGQNIVRTTGYSTTGVGSALYIYDAAVNGAYVTANPRAAFLAEDGRGFRIDPQQPLTVEMFGGAADWNGTTGTDNWPALQAALASDNYAPEFAIVLQGPKIHFGLGEYYFASSISLQKITHLVGMSSGQNNFVGGTKFVFPADTTGLFINNLYTDGNDAAVTQFDGFSDGSIIEGIQFESLGGTNPNAHGIRLRSRATIVRCIIGNFYGVAWPGNGIHIVGNTGSLGSDDFYGNCNNWRLQDIYIEKVKGHGLYVSGTDANAGACVGFETRECGGCGILDISGLGGNAYTGLNIAGYANSTPFKGRVSHGGRHYQLITTTVSGASVTPGTNENVWYDMGAAGAWPAWSALGTYSPDIPVLMEGSSTRNTISGLYTEGGMSHVAVPSIVLGGQATLTRLSGALNHIANSAIAAAVSPTGVGGFRSYTSGGPGYTGNGAYAYSTIGGLDPEGVEYPPLLLEHRRAGDGEVSWFWGWIASRDQYYRRLNQKGVWRITGQQTTTTFGRATAVPYIMSLPQMAIEDPATSGSGRIMNICATLPVSGEIAKGERYWMNNASAGGFAENYCTTGGVIGSTAVLKTCNPISA